jgi:hypothetical protein
LNLSDLTGSKVQRVGKHGPTICVRELARSWRLKWSHLNRRRRFGGMRKTFLFRGEMQNFNVCRTRQIKHEISQASQRDADTGNGEQSHAPCCEATRASTACYIKFRSHYCAFADKSRPRVRRSLKFNSHMPHPSAGTNVNEL